MSENSVADGQVRISFFESHKLISRILGPSGLYRVALIGLLLVSLWLYLWRFDSFQVGTYVDDAEYIVLAKSILAGNNYGLINSPGAVAQTICPFGWPLLLTPVMALSGGSFQTLKIVSLLFTLLNIWLIARGWKHLGIPNLESGFATAVLYAVSPMVVGHARMVMSEPAFTFFALLTLILTAIIATRDNAPYWAALALGIVWMFSAYVRTIGLVLVVASLAFLVLKRRWQQIALACVGLAISLGIVFATTPVDWRDAINTEGYRDQFANPDEHGLEGIGTHPITRARQGFVEYVTVHLRDAMLPFVSGPTVQSTVDRIGLGFVPLIAAVTLFVMLVAGYVLSIHRGSLLPVHLYVPLYLMILIVWPWRGERFLYGILPFLYSYLMVSAFSFLQAISRRVPFLNLQPRSVKAVGVLLLFGFLCVLAARSILIDDSLNHVRDFSVGTSWIRDHTPKDAVVIAEQPLAIYLYSERATVDLSSETQSLQDMLPSGASFLLVAPELRWSVDGTLTYSQRTRDWLDDAIASKMLGDLVFEDRAAMVAVYHLEAGESSR